MTGKQSIEERRYHLSSMPGVFSPAPHYGWGCRGTPRESLPFRRQFGSTWVPWKPLSVLSPPTSLSYPSVTRVRPDPSLSMYTSMRKLLRRPRSGWDANGFGPWSGDATIDIVSVVFRTPRTYTMVSGENKKGGHSRACKCLSMEREKRENAKVKWRTWLGKGYWDGGETACKEMSIL